jgi:tRNA A37 threonylcarbamoyladenosine biosynthesis protein TsaE
LARLSSPPTTREPLREADLSAISGAMSGAAQPLAVFLMGTIGAGKTTLGRALARELGGGHVEGDDYQQPSKP